MGNIAISRGAFAPKNLACQSFSPTLLTFTVDEARKEETLYNPLFTNKPCHQMSDMSPYDMLTYDISLALRNLYL